MRQVWAGIKPLPQDKIKLFVPVLSKVKVLGKKMLLMDTYLCVYGICSHMSYEYMTLTKYVLPFIPIHILFLYSDIDTSRLRN